MTNVFREMVCATLGNMPTYIQHSLTNVDPDDDSHDNGSVAWMRCLLKTQSILRLPESVRDLVMKRYSATICYTYMKKFINEDFNISFNVDLGPAFNPEASIECFSVLEDGTISFTPEDISRMNQMHGGAAAVGSYCMRWSKEPVTDSDGNIMTYYMNDAHRDDPDVEPFVHYKPYVDFENPRVAGKFMNGGVSNYNIVKGKCISFGMSDQEAEQHLETIINYSGNIFSVVKTDEEQYQIKEDFVKAWSNNPLENRKEEKYIRLNTNELLYYILQNINNTVIAKCLLTAQYVLDNHGTAPLVPSLQKMYELMNDGIPEGITVEKICSYIDHPEVITKIETFVTEKIENLNKSLNIDTHLEISDELIDDVKTNCEDTLIRTFIGNTQDKITKVEKIESVSEETPVETPDVSVDTDCQICMQPGAVPININEDDEYCQHMFHPLCLAQWALSTTCSNHNCCPTCRKPFGTSNSGY